MGKCQDSEKKTILSSIQEIPTRKESLVLQVEHGGFTPLVFSATGGMAPRCTTLFTFFPRLSDLMATKSQEKLLPIDGSCATRKISTNLEPGTEKGQVI